jgi:HK97 family phage portal protein
VAHRSLLAALESQAFAGGGFRAGERRSTAFSSISAPSDRLLQSLGYPVKSGATVNADTAINVSTVYACAQLLSGVLARLPLRLLDTTSAGYDVITDHPACKLVQRTPDGFRTAFAWRQMMELGALLRGNAPSFIERNAYFEPSALRWMNPALFEIWRTQAGDPFYRYNGAVLNFGDVLVHKEMSLDGISGISPITAMREQIGLAITTQEHGSRYFSNGASPGVVLTAPLGATKEQMDRIRDEVAKNHGGVANSGKPFVAYGGLTVSTVSLSNADSQFLESRAFDVEEIARAFRVPTHLVNGKGASSWGTGIETMNRAFLDYSLRDRLTRFEDELNLSLLSEKDKDDGLYFKHDVSELTVGTALERAQTHQIYRNIGVESINDARKAEGMNDLPDNIGDRYDLPFNGNGGTNAADAASQKQKAGEKAGALDPEEQDDAA